MKQNTDKCHLFLNSQEPNVLKIGDLHINNFLCEKLLDINFDCKLKLNNYIKDISQKAFRKLNALANLTTYVGVIKNCILMNTFFKSQFSYHPLIWMRCNISLNTKISRLHERCLWMVYNDKNPTFTQLLEKDGFAPTHHQNWQNLAVDMLKVFRGLHPKIINKIFQFREEITYKLSQRSQFHILSVHSVFSGTESFKFLGPKIWAHVPNEMKQLEDLGKFRKEVKQW